MMADLIGPFGPSPDLNPALWEPMDCARCRNPITPDDEWFQDVAATDDGPAYHGGCLVG